ncbi:MAG: 2-isopropylmalate synthase [Candidatus Marsarchaeota archaeon]|nr:2-isopropylmalate synthase [Candidatus Marsarchaeota archaeon]
MQNILVLDSTLREGAQATRVRFSPEQALKIANGLNTLGVDFIEYSPIVSERSAQTAKDLLQAGFRSSIILHGRATQADIDLLLKFDPPMDCRLLSTSPVHLEHKLHMDRQAALEQTRKMIEYAKSHGVKMRFTCEDASRTNMEELMQFAKVAAEAGADRISITDTVGIMTPSSMHALIRHVRSALPNIGLDLHCHNDLGLALANALAGIEAGADCIHASINGAGERAGIPRLAEVVMALQVLYGQRNEMKAVELPKLSRLFSSITSLPNDPFSPIVGENVFRHKGGTHLGAVLRTDGKAYEAFSPTSLGIRRRVVVGEYSGRNVVRYLSDALGLNLNEEQVKKALVRLKEKEGDMFEFEV